MPRFLIITPEYDVIEPVTDEGQGPVITVADVIEIEADSARDAVVLGVHEMLRLYRGRDEFRWCHVARLSGLSPYAGVKAKRVVDGDWVE